MTEAQFQRLIKADRSLAIEIVAGAIFDSYEDLSDLYQLFSDLHCGNTKFAPLHDMTDEALLESAGEVLDFTRRGV